MTVNDHCNDRCAAVLWLPVESVDLGKSVTEGLPMPATVASLQRKAELQGNPIAALERFLRREEESEAGGKTGRDKMRFVGYVLELGYETARIITSDPYKL